MSIEENNVLNEITKDLRLIKCLINIQEFNEAKKHINEAQNKLKQINLNNHKLNIELNNYLKKM